MLETDAHALGALLQRFLLSPGDGLVPLYARCRAIARRYLGRLQGKGWQLPLELATDRDPMGNLVDEILAPLFTPARKGAPDRLRAYFHKQGVTAPGDTEPHRLEQLFMPFFFKEIRQQLAELYGVRDPEEARIRERFRRILQSSDYASVRVGGKELLCPAGRTDDCRSETPPAPRVVLERLAWESLLSCKTETALVRGLFSRLADLPAYSLAVEPALLLQVLVAVRRAYFESAQPSPAAEPSPPVAAALARLDTLIDEAVAHLENDFFPRLLRRNKLAPDHLPAWRQAARLYLNDYWHDGGQTDSPRTYFAMVMSAEHHEAYYVRYRYLFETMLEQAVDHVRERLQRYV